MEPEPPSVVSIVECGCPFNFSDRIDPASFLEPLVSESKQEEITLQNLFSAAANGPPQPAVVELRADKRYRVRRINLTVIEVAFVGVDDYRKDSPLVLHIALPSQCRQCPVSSGAVE